MSDELPQVDWDNMLAELNVGDSYCLFLEILTGLVDKYVPLAAKCPGKPKWLCPPPRALVRCRSRAWNTYKSVRSSYGRTSEAAADAWYNFSLFNRQYRQHSFNSRLDYEMTLARNIPSAPKMFHGHIRRKKKGRSPVGPLRVGSEVISDPSLISKVLLNVFCSVFDSSIPNYTGSHQICSAEMPPLVLCYGMVFDQLKGLDVAKAPGPDGIHPKLLRECAAVLAYPMLLIYRKSLDTGELPSAWTHALVSALFKAAPRHNPLNYRPLSLTAVTCKAFERIIYAHTYPYLEANGLLSGKQFGFRPNRSTEDQLLLMYGGVSGWLGGPRWVS